MLQPQSERKPRTVRSLLFDQRPAGSAVNIIQPPLSSRWLPPHIARSSIRNWETQDVTNFRTDAPTYTDLFWSIWRSGRKELGQSVAIIEQIGTEGEPAVVQIW